MTDAGAVPVPRMAGWSRAGVVVAGLAVAAALGAVIALRPSAVLGLLALAGFLAVVVLDLPLAVGLLVFLAFVNQVPFFNEIQNALVAMTALAAIRAFFDASGRGVAALRRQRWLFVALAALLLWMVLSLAWAVAPDRALTDIRAWVTSTALIPLMVATLHTRRDVQVVIACFVLGALVSVGAGLVGLQTLPPASSWAPDPGRLRGLQGDPNVLAGLVLAAFFLGCGLLATRRSVPARALLFVSVAVLAIGFFATESRGGLIAAAIVLPVVLVTIRRRRRLLAGVIAGVAVFGAVALLGGLGRDTNIGVDSSSGRNDLWRVAVRMSADHPLTGVGLGGFTVESARYSREVGPIDHAEMLVEKPQNTHDMWLQLLVETGIVGAALCLWVVALCLWAGVAAARRFRRVGKRDLALLSQAVTIASLAVLAAGLFISNSGNRPMWVLLALGPILLGIAARDPAPRPRW
jgi:O-antigen ligase